MPDQDTSTGNLANNSHDKVLRSQFFFFFQKWHHAYLQRACTEAEVSLQIRYFLVFQPHPGARKDESIPYSKHNNPKFDFWAHAIQNITHLGDLTLCNFAPFH